MQLPQVDDIQLDFKDPPVVEVLFSIRAAVPGDFDPKAFLEPVQKTFGDELPHHSEFVALTGRIKVKGDGSTDQDVTSGMTGYRFQSEDKSVLAHYLTQGLTLNFLPDYKGFTKALEMLKAHWAVYSETIDNAPITAISLRYIDRIDIPKNEESLDLDEYFTVFPTIPEGLSTHSTSFQYWLNDGTSDARTRVSWASIEDGDPAYWSFALDTESMINPADFSNEEEVWQAFDSLHRLCKFIFNDLTTDKCRTLFQ